MGRTIPSFRVAESQEIGEWRTFRYSLAREDRAFFDSMLRTAPLYASASSSAVRTSRFEGMTMAIVFHHQKLLDQIARAISELRRQRDRP
jgi:hypothetical protein